MISRARVFGDGEEGLKRIYNIVDRLRPVSSALQHHHRRTMASYVYSVIVEYEKALTAFDEPEDAERVHGR